MTYKAITICPVCRGKLKIKKLQCNECRTTIENDFEFSRFQYLNNEELKFIEVFVKCRGSIKDVEKEMGISYPTVRAKLDEVISSLGGKNTKDVVNTGSTRDIIDALEKGEVSPEEAVKRLKD
ncbi:DUF2089 domain-containing protein [Clostridium cylindrosporum]|uniref:DUF2089 domain-containing protein n=1 Tax=Clostridium cylindrosporum DSM 605 TaxID=1121307 RepID=A0A0J8DDE7_CLOCY|nr:DUF2089 domain-containing protein [Clostridium cylindrosporum]KMT22258.1 hypothetical protein CLCY_4c02310 [Clostridium cylindrosporum DSM 605]